MIVGIAALSVALACDAEVGESVSRLLHETYEATDSLVIAADASDDVRQCLDGLCWTPASFHVRCTEPAADRGDATVRFPSPIERGMPVNDLVAMEWYLAREESGSPTTAPAIVVVHESGSRMPAGRAFARSLRHQGFHTFLIHLPHYGLRRSDDLQKRQAERAIGPEMFAAFRQGIADVRRARDAVAVLPWVDKTHIALQGTSLGGILSSTVAGIDDGYDSVFLMLAGGDIESILLNGKRDAANIRKRLTAAGMSADAVAALARSIEPTQLAHRINADRTWLFSATFDTVIPPENARSLARAAGLAPTHHAWLPANHYSGAIYFPIVIDTIARMINGLTSGNGLISEPNAVP